MGERHDAGRIEWATGAEIARDRVRVALGDDRPEPLGDVPDGMVPRCRLHRIAAPYERHVDALRVVMEGRPGAALGARVAGGHRIIGVAGNRENAIAIDLDDRPVSRAIGRVLIAQVRRCVQRRAASPRPALASSAMPTPRDRGRACRGG